MVLVAPTTEVGVLCIVLLALGLGATKWIADFKRHKNEHFDTLFKTSGYLSEYRKTGTAAVSIRVAPNVSEGTTLISVSIMLETDRGYLAVEPLELLECWTTWPADAPFSDPGGKRLPIEVQNAFGVVGAPEAEKRVKLLVDSNQERGSTILTLVPADELKGQILEKIEFDTPNVFTSLAERRPYGRQRLILGMNLFTGPKRARLTLDYPSDLSLRGRNDGSVFYSIPTGTEESYQRNVSFVPSPNLYLRYTFGNDDASELAAPLFPVFYAGFGLLAMGFSLHLINEPARTNQIEFLAGLTFALATTTSFIEVIRSKRIYFASSVTGRASWEGVSIFLCTMLHLVGVVAVAIALAWNTSIRGMVEQWTLRVGGSLIVVWLALLLALSFGILQGYVCDECDQKLMLRVLARVNNHPRRQAVCLGCRLGIPRIDVTIQRLVKVALLRQSKSIRQD